MKTKMMFLPKSNPQYKDDCSLDDRQDSQDTKSIGNQTREDSL
jgi:hypothetical protein